jgi:hypothetical protein
MYVLLLERYHRAPTIEAYQSDKSRIFSIHFRWVAWDEVAVAGGVTGQSGKRGGARRGDGGGVTEQGWVELTE